MTQGVMKQAAASLMYPASNSNSSSINKTENTSFQNLLMNIGKNINTSGSIKVKDSIKNETQTEKKMNVEQFRKKPFKAQQPFNTISDDNTLSDDNAISVEDENELFSSVSNEEAKDTEENILSKTKSLLDENVTNICKILKISEEELIKRMEIMGLSMIDLTDISVLKQLVLDNAGTNDPAYLLTNEDTADTLAEIYKQLDELLIKSELSKETLDEVLKSSEFSDYMKTYETDNKVPDKHINDDDLIEAVIDTVDGKETEFQVIRMNDDGKEQPFGNDKKKDSKESMETQESQGQNFINKAAELSSLNSENALSQIEYTDQLKDIANQILEQIKIVIKPAQTSMELTLNPENLGKVNLNVISKDGVLTAHFTAQNQIAKEAIESNIQFLRESLESQGIKVEKIEVALSEYTFQKDAQADTSRERGRQQQGRKKIQIEAAKAFTDISSIDEPENIILQDRGLNIDYTA